MEHTPGTLYPVDSWMTEEAAAEKYGSTLDWSLDQILALAGEDRERATGRSWHVGGGRWVAVCPSCDTYTLTAGPLPIYYGIGRHMVDTHPGAQVPGINVGLLG